MCEWCEQFDEPQDEPEPDQTVEMWPISKILSLVTESSDCGYLDNPGDWFRMMAIKANDASFGRLLQAIPKQGFLDPIGITWEYDHYRLGNGHHRLTAAILLGLDEIPVIQSFWASSDHDSDLREQFEADSDTCRMVSHSLHNDAFQAQFLRED